MEKLNIESAPETTALNEEEKKKEESEFQKLRGRISAYSVLGSMNLRRKVHNCESSLLKHRDHCRYFCLSCREMCCDWKELAQHAKAESHLISLELDHSALYCSSCTANCTPPGTKEEAEELKEFIKAEVELFKEENSRKRPVTDKLTYRDLVDGLAKGRFKKIGVMTGAGISVSAGIPDFRSPGSGLYDNLQKYNLPMPEALFMLDYFKMNPQPFFTFCQGFDISQCKPTPTHYFIVLLERMGLLRMNYTQNIDALEERAGLNVQDKLMQAHGSVKGARCTGCSKKQSEEELKEYISRGEVYRCKSCSSPVKPNIVFFGESMPADFREKYMTVKDCDLLLIMGTALAVSPFNTLVDTASADIPKVLINRENTARYGYDFTKDKHRLFLEGSCDEVIMKLIKDCRWEKEFEAIPKL